MATFNAVSGKKGKIQPGTVVLYFVIVVITFLILYPFWYCIAYSLSSSMAVMTQNVTFLPIGFTLENYQNVFKQNHLGSSFLVSVLRTLGGIVGTLLVTGLAAYAMSKKNMPGKRGLSLILIIPMYISGGLIPTYVWMYQLKLVNSFWIFILPNCFWAFNMLLMRTYFAGIPESLEESARLDGAGDLTILFRIILPLSMPIVAVIAMYSGVWQWNAWYDAMLYITSPNLKPLQAILQEMIKASSTSAQQMAQSGGQAMQNQGSPEAVRMATLVFTTLPIVCIYPFFQKYFVQGIMIGAVKA